MPWPDSLTADEEEEMLRRLGLWRQPKTTVEPDVAAAITKWRGAQNQAFIGPVRNAGMDIRQTAVMRPATPEDAKATALNPVSYVDIQGNARTIWPGQPDYPNWVTRQLTGGVPFTAQQAMSNVTGNWIAPAAIPGGVYRAPFALAGGLLSKVVPKVTESIVGKVASKALDIGVGKIDEAGNLPWVAGRAIQAGLTGRRYAPEVGQALQDIAAQGERSLKSPFASELGLAGRVPKKPVVPEVLKDYPDLVKPVPKGAVEPAVKPLPQGWRVEVGKVPVESGLEGESVTGKAMADWQRKTITVSDANYLRDPEIINHEVAHIRLEELPDTIRQRAIAEYEKVAKYTPAEVRSEFARREGLAQDYGDYLVDPSSVTPEIGAVFKKYFPEPPAPKGAVEPAVPAGYTRLYRGEGKGYARPITEGKEVLEGQGRWFSIDKSVAAGYGGDIYYVDVPHSVAAKAIQANSELLKKANIEYPLVGDHLLSQEWASKAKLLRVTEPAVPAGQARAAQSPESVAGAVKPPAAPPAQGRRPLWEGIENAPTLVKADIRPEAVTPEAWQTYRAELAAKRGGKPPTKPPIAGTGGAGGSELDKAVAAMTPDKQPVGGLIARAYDAVAKAVWSNLYPLFKLEKATGVPTFKLAERVSGAAAEGQVILARRALPILDKVAKDVKPLETYMTLMRDMDILARNPQARFPGGVRNPIAAMDQLKQAVGPQRFAAIDQAAKELWELNRQELDYLVDRGLLTSRERLAIGSAHPHYIPFQREDFTSLDIPAAVKRAVGSLSDNDIERMALTGSERKLDKPLERFLEQIPARRVLAARNDAAKGIHLALQEMAEKAGQEMPKVSKVAGELVEDKNLGILSYLDHGEQIRVQVPRAIADAAKGMDPDMSQLFYKVARTLTAPFRLGATTYNPGFMVTNIARDTLTAAYRGKLVPLSKAYRTAFAAVAKQNPEFDRLAKSGGFLSGLVSVEGGMPKVGVAIKVRSAKDAALVLPRLMQKMNIAAEQMTRAAVGEKVTQQGPKMYLTANGRDVARLLKDANIGVTPHDLDIMTAMRDTTVNFSRMGTWMRPINAVIPFSNAAAQGSINLARTTLKHPKWFALASGMASAGSAAVWLNNQRFESSKDIPQYYYQNYWPVMIGEGVRGDGTKFPVYISIPKAEVGAFLSMPGEIMSRLLWDSGNKSMVENALDVGLRSVSPSMPIQPDVSSFIPPVLRQGVEWTANYDFYRGSPIVPRGEQDRLAEMQFGAKTSETAVALGRAAGVSPRKVEAAIKGYFAGMGSDALWTLDMGLGALHYNPQVYGGVQATRLTPVEQASKLPVASRLLRTTGAGQEQQGWDKFNQVTQEGQKTLYKASPELNRLGISYSPVAANIGERQLTPDERAQLQKKTNELAEVAVKAEVGNAWYKAANDERRKVDLQGVISKAREQARIEFLRGLAPTQPRKMPIAPTAQPRRMPVGVK